MAWTSQQDIEQENQQVKLAVGYDRLDPAPMFPRVVLSQANEPACATIGSKDLASLSG